MRARLLLAGGLLAAVAALSACGSNPPKTGEVIAKEFHAAHRYTYLVPIFTGKSTIIVPETGYKPDEWDIELRGDCKLDRNGQQKCRTGWLQVDETTYHRYTIGATYP